MFSQVLCSCIWAENGAFSEVETACVCIILEFKGLCVFIFLFIYFYSETNTWVKVPENDFGGSKSLFLEYYLSESLKVPAI